MSLATSCPACGTVFKVIEDQLKVSEGWVRCGHCHDVFNALEGLFDLEGRQRQAAITREETQALLKGAAAPPPAAPASALDDTPTDWIETRPAMFSDIEALRARQMERDAERVQRQADPQPPASPEPATLPPPPESEAQTAPLPPPAEAGLGWPELPEPDPDPLPAPDDIEPTVWAPHPPEASAPVPAGLDVEIDDTVFQPHEPSRFLEAAPDPMPLLPPVDDAAAPEPAVAPPEPSPAPPEEDPLPASAPPLPEFARAADRAAWWRRPAVRITLGLLCLVSAAGLGLQWAHYQRDLLAARWPQLQPALQWGCEQLDCEVQAPRLLDALAVENTSLTRPSGVDGYKLQVLLRNRAEHPVRAPNLELGLTDAQGAVIVRRVLTPADFRQAAQLSASAESNWQLEMTCSDKRIAGFTVAVFYP